MSTGHSENFVSYATQISQRCGMHTCVCVCVCVCVYVYNISSFVLNCKPNPQFIF